MVRRAPSMVLRARANAWRSGPMELHALAIVQRARLMTLRSSENIDVQVRWSDVRTRWSGVRTNGVAFAPDGAACRRNGVACALDGTPYAENGATLRPARPAFGFLERRCRLGDRRTHEMVWRSSPMERRWLRIEGLFSAKVGRVSLPNPRMCPFWRTLALSARYPGPDLAGGPGAVDLYLSSSASTSTARSTSAAVL